MIHKLDFCMRHLCLVDKLNWAHFQVTLCTKIYIKTKAIEHAETLSEANACLFASWHTGRSYRIGKRRRLSWLAVCLVSGWPLSRSGSKNASRSQTIAAKKIDGEVHRRSQTFWHTQSDCFQWTSPLIAFFFNRILISVILSAFSEEASHFFIVF